MGKKGRNIRESDINVAKRKFLNKQYDKAEIILRQILKTTPNHSEALQVLGLLMHDTGRFEQGVIILNQALSIEPNNPDVCNNLSLCYSNIGKYHQSIELLEKAIKLNPGCFYLYSNLGLQYRHLKRPSEAIPWFRRSLQIQDHVAGWRELGGCYAEQKQYEQAEKCFHRAILIDPNYGSSHVDLALIYLLQGEYARGWPEFEWRFRCLDQVKFWTDLYEPEKRWSGQQPLHGKRILIHTEQGHGDAIHFFRYIKYLPRDAYIILQCSELLAPLFADQVNETYNTDPYLIPHYSKRPKDFPIPVYDYHCSLVSLPYVLDNPPIPNCPYIKSDAKIDMDPSTFNVGICWCGSPLHANDQNRSVRLSYFEAIQDIPNIKLFGLVEEKRPRIYQFMKEPVDLTKGANVNFVDLSPQMTTFADTAAIVNSLDLVISVDTSLVHLCGAMNKKSWALTPWNQDWRWGTDGDHSPWYPSLRLFRQPTLGDWNTVFQKVREECLKLINVTMGSRKSHCNIG